LTDTIKLSVNGEARVLKTDDPNMPLLYALRDQLGLHGLHYGCGLGQCGACTVHYYGEALRSCILPVSAAAGAEIVTLEGLGTAEKPHPVQQAFIDEQAAQCGYCINGMIMQAAALLATTKRPTEEQVRQALAGNLCKCGTHVRILRAVMLAAERMS
jgi:nicotinate dehydrogenase subunit A